MIFRSIKRITLFLFILIFLPVLHCVHSKAESSGLNNLLFNTAFEMIDESGVPEGWYEDAYRLNAGYTGFQILNMDVSGENKAVLRIQNFDLNDARLAQTVQVRPESLYHISALIMAEQIEEGHGANISIEGLYAFSEEIFDTNGEWKRVDWYGETGPDQHDVTIFLRLGGYSGESRGKAFFTDVQMEEADELPDDIVAALWFDTAKPAVYADDDEEADVAFPAWPVLLLISIVYAFLACVTINGILRRKSVKIIENYSVSDLSVIFTLCISLLLRCVISYLISGYQVDVNCFTSWGHTLFSVGAGNFYSSVSFCDYPPAYLPVLGLNAGIVDALSLSAGWTRVVYRLFPSLCDVCACAFLYLKYRKTTGSSLPAFACAIGFMAFSPVSVLNSAAWGQMDSVLCLLILLVAVFALEEKWAFALPVYMLAVLTKPQALILGPLGLVAAIVSWRKKAKSGKSILIGLIGCLIVFFIVIWLFTGDQPLNWIFELYENTLSSYPYVTVNTANLYYLLGCNWRPAGSSAAIPSLLLLIFLAGVFIFFWKKKAAVLPKWHIEFIAGILFLFYMAGCTILKSSWIYAGYGSMVFSFFITVSLYIRKKDLHFLPYAGAMIFILFYVFGIKMHERYLFPALSLLMLSWLLLKDYRILRLALVLSLCVFLNEGIVLDNSIRLGSSMGHLNQDTVWLADIISLLNTFAAIYAVWIGLSHVLQIPTTLFHACRFYQSDSSAAAGRKVTDYHPDHLLHWKKADSVLLTLMTVLYGAVSLMTLGSSKAPQTFWKSSSYEEQIVFDLGESHPEASMMYFGQVILYDFSVAHSPDGSNWSDEIWAQTYQQCWKWKYLTDSYIDSSGKRKYLDSGYENIIRFSDRYVRLTSHQIGLKLNEIIFKTDSGSVLPVRIAEHLDYNTESEMYSDPSLLLDEQNTLEGLPLHFGDAEGVDTAQPSWWNSTYFDEIYHARTAYEFIQHSVPYETTHPPLGKILISWGIMLFGMTPFGWRFAGAVAGILMIPGMYLLGKQLTKKTSIGALCGLLVFLDCQHLTQTQIATIDSFPVLFIIFSYFFMLRFVQTDLMRTPRGKVLISLAASGCFMGLSIASKWIGIYAGAGLGVLFFWHCARTVYHCREAEKWMLQKDLKEDDASGLYPCPSQRDSAFNPAIPLCLKYCAWCILFFILQPLIIYLLSYIPYFAYNPSAHHVAGYLNAVWQSQIGMLNYHSTKDLGMDHPFYSPWWEWPVNGKPMYYASESYELDIGLFHSIFCFGNPVIWYGGLVCLLICMLLWIRGKIYRTDGAGTSLHWFRKDYCNETSFILIGFLAQYLPWMLVPRGTYIYHYFASTPFIILSAGFLMYRLKLKNKHLFCVLYCAFIILALTGFVLLFPFASGIMAPVSWLDPGTHLLRIWY